MPLPSAVAADVIGAYRREYMELTDNWARIETKAQGTAVVAGTLLSATVALLTSERFSVPKDLYFFFPLIALLLFYAACLSWKAITIRDTTIPSPGDQVRDYAVSAHASSTPTYQSFREAALEAQIESWSEACSDLHLATAGKADAVFEAQCWLLVAGGFAMLFVLCCAIAILQPS
jgi:hypothetical protein